MELKSLNKLTSTLKSKPDVKVWIAFGILLLVIIFIRYRLLNVPLERDEGEYAYMGQLILQKIHPYDIAYNMKFPGVYYIYAFFMAIFGQTTSGIHLGLLIVNILSTSLIFLIVKKLVNNFAALAASTAFAFLALSDSVLGFAGHATNFVLIFVLSGFYLLMKAREDEKKTYYFLSGLLFGLSPIMKQPAIFFCLFSAVFFAIHLFRRNRNGYRNSIIKFVIFGLGGIIPFIGLVIAMKAIGVFDKFWFWTITYAADYINQVPFKDAISIFFVNSYKVMSGYFLIWLLAFTGLALLIFHKKFKNDHNRILLISFFIFSYCSIFSGLYFRSHYFITLLPIIAILFGVTIDYLYTFSKEYKNGKFYWIPVPVFAISILIGIYVEKDYLFNMSPNEISQQVYGYNPFIESPEIAEYIKSHSNPEDKIAILGSEPQICFYSNRKSVTGYLYVYSLMENQRNSLNMQKEMVSDIESGNPKFILIINISYSWIKQKGSNPYIFNWMDQFLSKGKYLLTGVIDILPENSIYKWGDDAIGYYPKSKYYIQIFEKL